MNASGHELREQVKAEALANGYLREAARQAVDGGVRGRNAAFYARRDKIAEIAERLSAANRYREIKTPSDLIAMAKAEWPEQSARVKAYADAEGLALGEAWATIIGTAVATLAHDGE